MRVRVALSVASLALLPVAATAEAPMIAVDAGAVEVGPVLQLPTPENSMTGRVMYRHTGNEFLVLKVSGATVSSAGPIWYSGPDCTGQAWVIPSGEIQPGIPYPVGFRDNAQNLRRVAPGAVTSNQLLDCEFFGPGICDCSEDFNFAVVPVTNLGPFPFVLPLQYVLNPAIFLDQFQTGDTERWSNEAP